MARFITVHVRCDWTECDTISEEGEGTVAEKMISIDGKQPKVFLLCKKHLEDFEAFLMPLMQAGVKVEVPKKQRAGNVNATSTGSTGSTGSAGSAELGAGYNEFGLVDCKDEDCDRRGRRGLTNRTGLAQHVIRTHKFTSLAAYEAEYGPVG